MRSGIGILRLVRYCVLDPIIHRLAGLLISCKNEQYTKSVAQFMRSKVLLLKFSISNLRTLFLPFRRRTLDTSKSRLVQVILEGTRAIPVSNLPYKKLEC